MEKKINLIVVVIVIKNFFVFYMIICIKNVFFLLKENRYNICIVKEFFINNI